MKRKSIIFICFIAITLSSFAQSQCIYYNYALDNKSLNGNNMNYGPIFIKDELSFCVDHSKKGNNPNYIIKFSGESDIKSIELVYTGKRHEISNKNIFAGHIEINDKEKKNCIVLTKIPLEIFCIEGGIEVTLPYTILIDNSIDIIYNEEYGVSHRILYPLIINTTDFSEKIIEESILKENKGINKLKNRKMIEGTFKAPKYNVDEEGIAIVNIIVNPLGEVISANIGEGTNIMNQSLLEESLKAAKQIKFTTTNSDENEEGTITYKFNFK